MTWAGVGTVARRTSESVRRKPVLRASVGAPARRTGESGQLARVGTAARRAGEGGWRAYRPLRARLVRMGGIDLLGRPCGRRVVIMRPGLTLAASFPFIEVFAFFSVAAIGTVLARGPRRAARALGSSVSRRRTGRIGITTGRAAAMTQVAVPVVFLITGKAGIRLTVRPPFLPALRLFLPVLFLPVLILPVLFLPGRAGLAAGQRDGRPAGLGPVLLTGTPRIPEALPGGPRVGIVLRCTRPAQLLLVLRPSAAHEPSHS
jgi:hypothetical protein